MTPQQSGLARFKGRQEVWAGQLGSVRGARGRDVHDVEDFADLGRLLARVSATWWSDAVAARILRAVPLRFVTPGSPIPSILKPISGVPRRYRPGRG